MTFNEANTVEAFIRDLLCGGITHHTAVGSGRARRSGNLSGLGWHYLAARDLPRSSHQVLVEPHLREALIRLNPEIAARPDRADEVVYRLRAILMTVEAEGLVTANKEFAAWLTGERSMPFGPEGEHVTVRLLDFEDPDKNEWVVTQQYIARHEQDTTKRADLVLLVNGIPLVVIEAKTPVRLSESWLDGAIQIEEDYQKNVPELFVPNLLSIATEGKEFRYGGVGLPAGDWGPWRPPEPGQAEAPALKHLRGLVASMLQPETVLDLAANFTAFVADPQKGRIKIIARHQQVEATNRIVERVVAGRPRQGLIWHFQGSGKTELMLFAARKLRLHPELQNPAVLVVVDRVDLDTQHSATFRAAELPNLVRTERTEDLVRLLAQDTRKVIVTTIFKFGEAEGVLNDSDNLIVLVDEAHRTQEGDLGRRMRRALPNAFLFGLTGTPINRGDKNTFLAFGAEEDANRYLSRYGFEESVADGATLPLHFEPRLLELHVDQDAMDAEFAQLTGGVTDAERERLAGTAARTAVLLKTPERVEAICADIADHYRGRVEPHGFGAQVVTYDRESCVLYKRALDRHLSPDASAVVMTAEGGEREFAAYRRDREEEARLLDRFRDPGDPLKILIVTSKLLTGFNAPILQTMYLDKPIRDIALVQAICRANRPYGKEKKHDLIVDYLGVFDDVARTLRFDEKGLERLITNLEELIDELPEALRKCLAYFGGVDRSVFGYEGLIAAQECLPDNATRDRFAADYVRLARLWEIASPRPPTDIYEADYRWLTQVYRSLQPSTGTGRLLWHNLGAKTIQLIQRNVHVDTIQDDLDEVVLDAETLQAALAGPDAERKAREVEIRLGSRLRRLAHDPKFRPLGERLEALREKHLRGALGSIAFLKSLLELARDVLEAERTATVPDAGDPGKAALTALFEEVRNERTPIIVERVVNDIDEIVRQVRFDGWQSTHAGERIVKKELRRTLLKYRLHKEKDLFDRAYGYIQQYY